MLREGGKLRAVLPDQGERGIGTLMIPCSVSLVAGAKNPEPAKELIDYLLTPGVEQKLIAAKFAAYSVFSAANRPKPMPVDYAQVATNLTASTELALTILGGRQ
jgi:ABC-type Fe3+ transport system substrate-binding protein